MIGGRKSTCACVCTYGGQKWTLGPQKLDIQEFVGCLACYLVLGSRLVVMNALQVLLTEPSSPVSLGTFKIIFKIIGKD